MRKICPRCEQRVEPDATKCGVCGEVLMTEPATTPQLTVKCSACGQEADALAIRCPSCGANMPAPQPAAASPATPVNRVAIAEMSPFARFFWIISVLAAGWAAIDGFTAFRAAESAPQQAAAAAYACAIAIIPYVIARGLDEITAR